MLENYDKYQSIWFKNLMKFEDARNKLNHSALCKNHKVNATQALKGDLSIMERIELKNDFKKNKEFLDIAFKPGIDHNIGWHCSLRQHEHDNEYDGMRDLHDPKNATMGRNK